VEPSAACSRRRRIHPPALHTGRATEAHLTKTFSNRTTVVLSASPTEIEKFVQGGKMKIRSVLSFTELLFEIL
jgi:hypothetical protein